MTNDFYPTWDRKSIKAHSKKLLSKKGVLLSLIFSVIICCLIWMAVELCEAFLYSLAAFLFPQLLGLAAFYITVYIVFDVISILLTAPAVMGAFRIASLFSMGRSPHLTEIFYYFSPKKYGRALAAFSVSALPVIIYCEIFRQLFSVLAVSIESSKVDTFTVVIAVMFFFMLAVLAIICALALLLPYGRLYSVIAAVVCGEGQPLGLCIRAGIRATKKKTGSIFAFRMSFVLWILLSISTIGMLFVIFTVPYMLISYFDHNAVLFGKEPTPVQKTEVIFDER